MVLDANEVQTNRVFTPAQSILRSSDTIQYQASYCVLRHRDTGQINKFYFAARACNDSRPHVWCTSSDRHFTRKVCAIVQCGIPTIVMTEHGKSYHCMLHRILSRRHIRIYQICRGAAPTLRMSQCERVLWRALELCKLLHV